MPNKESDKQTNRPTDESAPKQTCCIVVYGCAKNQVDAEEMASRLTEAGYAITGDTSQSDVIIVHTCGFIEDAKRESIEGIFQAVEAAQDRAIASGNSTSGRKVPVIVTGCLSQRYPDELLDEVPEISGVAGTAAPRDIVEIVSSVLQNTVVDVDPAESQRMSWSQDQDRDQDKDQDKDHDRAQSPNHSKTTRVRRVAEPGRGSPGGPGKRFDRHVTSPSTYVRVAEGCRHHCTYCAIPSIRGDLRSRPEDEIIAEAQHLAALGVVELNLIAQDLSDYGWDLEVIPGSVVPSSGLAVPDRPGSTAPSHRLAVTGRRRLAGLVRRLNDVDGIRWIRLLYVKPDGVDRELAEAMALPHVAPYVDLPLEHGSPRILRLMGRPGVDDIVKAVENLRAFVPDLYLRTTIITGFPGETEKDVLMTMELLTEIRAHRVGVFPFSREEGTPAYNLPNPVPSAVARERAEAIRRLGLHLAAESGAAMVDREVNILLERPSARPGYWIGRGPHQAPEVDGTTYVKTASQVPGFIRARVTGSGILTLFARETST